MDYNNNFKKGIQEIKKASLSKNEKEGMLARLTEYAEKNPINSVENVSWFTFVTKPAFAFVMASIVIIIGGNISYAAADSLPGDLLYPIKIHVNEKIKGAFTITPKAAAKWEEKKIENRLDEVERLVEKGEFDTQKRVQVEKEVEKNVEKIRKQKGKEKNSDFTEAIDTKFKKIHEIDEQNQKTEVKHLEQKIQDELHILDHKELKKITPEKVEKENRSDRSKHQR